TATARSITLPVIIKFLNSFNIIFVFSVVQKYKTLSVPYTQSGKTLS
ncbi:MAG: hypothetical protein ACI9NN_000068, partial [Bacteroidia bacterium]